MKISETSRIIRCQVRRGGQRPGTHATVREVFLTEVGLPATGLYGTANPTRCREPITREWDTPEGFRACSGMPDDLDSVFGLDFMDSWDLLLDGRTGLVHEVHEGMEHAYATHRDVESYVYAIHRDRALWSGRDQHRGATFVFGDNLVLELFTYEPLAAADPRQCWAPALSDLSDGIW